MPRIAAHFIIEIETFAISLNKNMIQLNTNNNLDNNHLLDLLYRGQTLNKPGISSTPTIKQTCLKES